MLVCEDERESLGMGIVMSGMCHDMIEDSLKHLLALGWKDNCLHAGVGVCAQIEESLELGFFSFVHGTDVRSRLT
jgi:hypothetical protein